GGEDGEGSSKRAGSGSNASVSRWLSGIHGVGVLQAFWRGPCAPLLMLGSPGAAGRFCWRVSSTHAASQAPGAARQTGFLSARHKDVLEGIAITKLRAPRPSSCSPFHSVAAFSDALITKDGYR